MSENKSNKWQRLTTYTCNGNAALNFVFPGSTAVQQPVPKPQPAAKTIVSQSSEWEYWIVAARRNDQFKIGEFLPRFNPEVGHSWNALIKKTVTKFSDGSIDSTNWTTDTTFEFNPGVDLVVSLEQRP